MGIKDINKFLKEKAPRAFRSLPTSLFEGTRFVVDAPLFGFASYAAAYTGFIARRMTPSDMLTVEATTKAYEVARPSIRRQVTDRATYFVSEFYQRGITPVFVFDGEAAPEKTSGARTRRLNRREATKDRIEKLRAQINDSDPLFRSDEDLALLRNLLQQLPPVKPEEDLAHLRAHLEAQLAVRTVSAPDEAEKFCARLAANGFASASWTVDTDSYAFGAPIVITGFDEARPNHFSAVLTPMILTSLGLSHAQFVDLCIMFECDFNSRIPKVGPAKTWELLSAARDVAPDASRLIEIAAISKPTLDWEILNAERCRTIFLDHSACDETFRDNRDAMTRPLLLRDILSDKARNAADFGLIMTESAANGRAASSTSSDVKIRRVQK